VFEFDYAKANNEATFISRRLQRAGQQAIRRGFMALGTDMREQARRSILHDRKTGRIYLIRLGKRRKYHQASAEGESPANMTGNLRRSIHYQVRGSDGMDFGYGNEAPYGKWLEEGTSRMKERPNIVPVARSSHNKAKSYFYKALKREIMKVYHEVR
jgi:HK97 gp10 family phage protein